MSNRHNVFISYHHQNDQYYKERFETLFNRHYDIIASKSVQMGDINENLPADRIRQIIRDEYLRTSTVTIVLIGSETWKRKHIDWEIGASIRDTKYNSRSGLIGIILPSYSGNSNNFNPRTIPPRLNDNLECGFSKIYDWSESPQQVSQWIHEAFLNRNNTPNNSYPNFVNNRNTNEWR